ncbi:reductase [Salmonella enterica subsp. arizonae]|uniref:Reductase n=1 Tax=Salmonella enterica subsp. arizonae TaxID=59203 RepID=A0A2X4TJQ1_SALER|nr:reductase [Salmonella enterica subsp. arizonae]
MLEFAPEMKADQVLQDKVRSLKNVDIILNAQTTEVKGDGSKVVGLEYLDRVSGDIHSVALAGILCRLVCCRIPNWLEGALERNRMARSLLTQNVKPALRVFSLQATVPPFLTNRLSSPQAKGRKLR